MVGSVNVDTIQISAKEALMAVLEGATVTHTHVQADEKHPVTNLTVVEFKETPGGFCEDLSDSPEIRNRLGPLFDE